MWSVLVISSLIWSVLDAQNVYVLTPKSIRLGTDENIALVVDGIFQPQKIDMFIQDYPGKRKNISVSSVTVVPGNPKTVKVRIDPQNVPKDMITDPTKTSFLNFVAVSGAFRQEFILPLTWESGFVFLMTDKPVYNPQQHVHFRIISLNEEGLPSKDEIRFQIKNPKNVVVREIAYNDKKSNENRGFIITPKSYMFPRYPLLGSWSATVLYGHKFQQSSSVNFTLKEYVLPTFTVKLETPDVILPHDKVVPFTVEAKYVYGEPVDGTVTFHIGIENPGGETNFFLIVETKQLDEDGKCTEYIRDDHFRQRESIGWFPKEGSHFVVQAVVIDAASGETQEAIDRTARFSKSPFEISFKNSLKDFRPGLVSLIEGEVRYMNGQPAKGIRTIITKAVANKEKSLKVNSDVSISNDDGRIFYEVHPENFHNEISVTIKTDDRRFLNAQAEGHHVQTAFKSSKNAFIAISRRNRGAVKPGEMFSEQVHFNPKGIKDMYSMVISRGRILFIKKLLDGEYQIQNAEFLVTHNMTPSFRLVVFAKYEGELIADSLRVEVERECHRDAQITITPDFGVKPEPAQEGKIILRGKNGTHVGLMAVDSAIYSLSNKGVLTRRKMFDTFESHDSGCGPGGGFSTSAVFNQAGVHIITEGFKLDPNAGCEEKKREKRRIMNDILNSYSGRLKDCCALGLDKDKYSRNCEKRTDIVKNYLKENDKNCSEIFFSCCLHAQMERESSGFVQKPRSGNFLPDLKEIDISMFKDIPTARKDFRETWAYKDFNINIDDKKEVSATLPHSITTWVIHAVSVSDTHGMCVADTKEIQSSKKVFLQLNLPYSVVRNEQIEIRATLFNYGEKTLSAIVFMYGVKDLCSGAQEGERSEHKTLLVQPHSGQTVSFPVIPLKEGVYHINVVALSFEGSDNVKRKLIVVPEGEVIEKDITVMLDPSNQQNRPRREVDDGILTDAIDGAQKLQVTTIKLDTEGAIPGTETCIISAIGDHFGPTVQTSLKNPDDLLRKPSGCAEQNMILFAPTLYTMKYLKETGKISAEIEAKGYDLIRKGYDWQMTFRKNDGSFGAWKHTPPSTWLTAYVTKVFCQANKLVHIDQNIMCSGVEWLLKRQKKDGSFVENHPVYHRTMMGASEGHVPMTAFILIMLEECSCDVEDVHIKKAQALSFIEEHLGEIDKPLPLSIVAYALALSESEIKFAGNNKLLSLATYDEERNTLFWETGSITGDVEASAYGLLSQLKLNDMTKSNSIVNWLNSKRLSSGSFDSTQDTVVALQALSEYAVRAKMPGINLVSNITSSSDINYVQTMTFHERNSQILQEAKIDKLGDIIFINTVGHGMGHLSVKLRYNIRHPSEKLCKFEVLVNVTAEKEIPVSSASLNSRVPLMGQNSDHFEFHEKDPFIRGTKLALDAQPDDRIFDFDPRNRIHSSENVVPLILDSEGKNPVRRMKRKSGLENNKLIRRINICLKYLGDKETEMAIVDSGIFSGFKPWEDDLKKLQKSQHDLIQRYEISGRGIIFYLEKVPNQDYYCFNFRIIREYIVGKTQSSIIKVYDYYNTEESCTVFYSPDHNSPLLRKFCSDDVCQCGEGGCPRKEPFSKRNQRDDLKNSACENHHYVWLGKVENLARHKDGLLYIKFRVKEVFKEGVEKFLDIKDTIRELMARDNCENAVLERDYEYVIMGRDGEKEETKNKEIRHRHFLDQTATVYSWQPTKRKLALQKNLEWLRQELKKGCDS